ncbi:MAG: DUF1707 domain-containing protein [Gemmatimonas sp.]|nr:DUF1707 domain-containing protein [Gemmatimonas sp.]
MTDLPSNPAALRRQSEATINQLCEHFAADHIQADELERLIDRAHLAKSPAELQALLEDLPAVTASSVPTRPPAKHIELHQTIVAIMGGADRKGSWCPARMTRTLALMGGAVLDFREVHLPPGTTDVQVYAVMGGVEIIVPPGVRVASEGIGIMGAFEHVASSVPPASDADAPLLRITGFALMGAVEIHERHPGESPRDANRRRKLEAKARRGARSRDG